MQLAASERQSDLVIAVCNILENSRSKNMQKKMIKKHPKGSNCGTQDYIIVLVPPVLTMISVSHLVDLLELFDHSVLTEF